MRVDKAVINQVLLFGRESPLARRTVDGFQVVGRAERIRKRAERIESRRVLEGVGLGLDHSRQVSVPHSTSAQWRRTGKMTWERGRERDGA